MTRRSRHLAPLALVALTALAGCQDYNFSPVNQCLLQPGSERVTLSDISTADILFVVDDSGSMAGKQKSLANSFGAFVTNLTATNQTRVQNGLEPIDFHIAITTTSVFISQRSGTTCAASCGGVTGQVCCSPITNLPLKAPRRCKVDADCNAAGGPWTCKTTNLQLSGELTCGNAAGAPLEDPVACATLGAECGDIQQRFQYTVGPRSCITSGDCRPEYPTCSTTCAGLPAGAAGSYCCNGTSGPVDQLQCNPGVSTGNYTLYPRGDFVKAPDSAVPVGQKPLVIHFTKDLFCTRTADGSACAGPPPASAAADLLARQAWFKANVLVGTCGSGQEMGLEAARRALQKALKMNGMSQPNDIDGLPPGWPHDRSKLVTVWVGDEDDCSTPEDPTGGIILAVATYPDSCFADALLPVADQKHIKLEDFASFFAGLGRPLASGFIESAVASDCVDAACTPGFCSDPNCNSLAGTCGGLAPGERFLALGQTFSSKGSEVVTGSICHPSATGTGPPDFSSILDRVAEVVKQPAGLQLPTQPSSAGLTILRIVGTDGKTRKTCTAPAPVGTTASTTPALDDFDWWFTDGNDLHSQVPTGATRFITINHAVHRCEANPGETYSADYLGLVPAEGCLTANDCNQALEKDPSNPKHPWRCSFETTPPTPGMRGTCTCDYAP